MQPFNYAPPKTEVDGFLNIPVCGMEVILN